jgi:hypothetical protein
MIYMMQEHKFRMSTENFVNKANVSVAKPVIENVTMGIRNLKVPSSVLIVRTMGKEQTFTFTFNTLKSVDLIHINSLSSMLGVSLDIELYLGEAKVYGAGSMSFLAPKPLIDYGNYFGLVPLGGYDVSETGKLSSFTHTLKSPIVATSCKITIKSPYTTYLDISKIFISSLFIPISTNISYGVTLSHKNSNVIGRSAGGGITSSKKFSVRVISLSLEYMNEADRATISSIFKNFVGDPVYISCFPTSGGNITGEYSGIFVITGGENSISHPSYGRFNSNQITFEEI